LGLQGDHDIVDAVSTDEDILTFMMQNLEEGECDTVDEGVMYVGKKLAPNQTKDYQRKRAEFVLDNYLLPHLNYLMPVGLKEEDPGYRVAVESVRLAKAHFLGRMAEACFDLVLHRRRIDDKDHYSNKRLKLAGDLMEDLFRISLNRLTRDVKYQLERASMRHRDLSIGTAVRADVLTERLLHPLATGNWVGGRTGVSQLLDRVDHMAVLSHLRRVISPLSRSQPHFEARDLHPTQWGRICPSETPEGPNCGLVKNFAQMVEISKGVMNEEEVKNILYDMGVIALRRETV
jgi:DNA-directed RNA polymerase subunit B"